MAFDNLVPQPVNPNPVIADYAKQVLTLSRIASEQVSYFADIDYGEEARQQLDIYSAKDNQPVNAPVLIFIHGGRWRSGYKEWNGFMAPAMVDLPAVLVSIRYGLSPDFHFPAPLHDCLQALAWVHRNIADYGGDPDRIFIGGHSAGGHLSALTTLRQDLYAQFDLPGNTIKGCFPLSGTMNFDFAQVLPGSEEEEVRSILLADPADAPQASPLRYAEGNTTAFFFASGENDFPRVMSTNQEMLSVLRAQSGEVLNHRFPGFNHFQTHLSLQEKDNPWWKTVKAWMVG